MASNSGSSWDQSHDRNDLSNYPRLFDYEEQNEESQFPWLANHHPVPVDQFPVPGGPLIFEGYVPDQYMTDVHEQVPPIHTDNINGRIVETEEDDNIHSRATFDTNDSDNDPSFESDTGEDNDQDDDELFSDEEAQEYQTLTPGGDGVYAGTRAKTSGILHRPIIRPSARSRRTGLKGRGGWNRGTKTGPRRPVEPSLEFNELHRLAINAYIDEKNYEKAQDLILQAIAMNPEIYSAHALLSEIYFEQNEPEKAFAAMFSGAHSAPRDPDVWQRVADACLQRSHLDRTVALQQASYCFSRLINIDKNDHDSRFQRASIHRELKNYAKALTDLEKIRTVMPRNSSVLRQIAEICLEIDQASRAREMYEEVIHYYEVNGLDSDETFTWSDLSVFADVIAHMNGAAEAILIIKQLARWILGRTSETYWDNITEDDREWDADDEPRRSEVDGFIPGTFSLETYGIGLPLELRIKLGLLRLSQDITHHDEAILHFEWLEPEDREESALVLEYSDLFIEVASALNDSKLYPHAIQYYQAVIEMGIEVDHDFWLGFAFASYVCGHKDEAVEYYEAARAADALDGESRTQLSKLYAERGEKAKATQCAEEALLIAERAVRKTDRRRYERKDQRIARRAAESALRQARKLPGPRTENELGAAAFARRKQTRQSRPKTIQEENAINRRRVNNEISQANHDDGIFQLWTTLDEATEASRDGEEAARKLWMGCAQALTDDFRRNKVFYPSERHMQFYGYDKQARRYAFQRKWQKEDLPLHRAANMLEMDADSPLPSVENLVPTEYCNIPFSAWLDIFLEYAILLANSGTQTAQSDCYTIINSAIDCTVWFHDPDSMLQIHVCYFTCALALRDSNTLVNTAARWFMKEFQYCTDTYRLFAAMNLFFDFPNDRNGKDGQMLRASFRLGPSQKFLFRQVASIDTLLPDDYGVDDEEGQVPDTLRRAAAAHNAIPSGNRARPGQFNGDDYNNNEIDEIAATARSPVTTTVMDEYAPIPNPHNHHAPLRPRELDPVLLTLYGHILYAGGSFHSALAYFYRAYALDPENPMLLLSMALSFIHQMFKRQNANRHFYLLQGLAFFEEYEKNRSRWADVRQVELDVERKRKKEQRRMRAEVENNDGDRDGMVTGEGSDEDQDQSDSNSEDLVTTVKREIEFNKARLWQMLGLTDMAVRNYGNILPLSENRNQDESKDIGKGTSYSMETAYSLRTLYALNGDMETAKYITEKWLVV